MKLVCELKSSIATLSACVTKVKRKQNAATRTVWSLEYPERGARFSAWTKNAAPHGPISGIFTVPGAGTWGLDGHVNGAPDVSGTTNDLNFTDSQLLGGANALEQIEVFGHKEIKQAGYIRDVNRNTGETAEVYCGGGGCCNSKLRLLEETRVSTSGTTPSRGVLAPTPVEPGVYPHLVRFSDLSAAMGYDLEWGPTEDGPWENLTDSYIDEPKWVCRQEPCDYQLKEGELFDVKPCCPTPYFPGSNAGLSEEEVLALIPEPVIVPRQEVCAGPFIGTTGRTGWLHGWSDVVQNANQPQIITDYIQVGREVVGPDCLHDAKVHVDVGNHYFLLRRIRALLWIDVRVMRNGVVCQAEAFDAYEYLDRREDTNPDVISPLQFLIKKPGGSNLTCFSGPPGAVYTVEVRYRYQGSNFQPSSYFRYIGGLRSEGDFIFQPKQIVIGRI